MDIFWNCTIYISCMSHKFEKKILKFKLLVSMTSAFHKSFILEWENVFDCAYTSFPLIWGINVLQGTVLMACCRVLPGLSIPVLQEKFIIITAKQRSHSGRNPKSGLNGKCLFLLSDCETKVLLINWNSVSAK